ncbi:hypothetical protein KBD59_02585, partial [Candidatus Gracilibacteria bacterium]|nr:hypothetical protein [Candidatus Gracilibacteria bacterium]
RVVTTAPRQHPDHPETLLPAGTLLSLETVEALERRSRDGEEVSTTAHVWSMRGQEGMPHLRTAVPDGSLIKDRRELANLRFPAARFGRPLSFDRAQQLLTSFNFRPGTTPDEMIQLFQAAIKTIQTYHRDIEKRPRHGSSGH